MAITTYTTYDTIRALFGVTGRELKDSVLALPMYETEFLLQLSAVDGDVGLVKAQYDTVAALPTRTSDQQRFFDLVNLLAAYSVAKQIIGSDDNAFPLLITDGKASMQRRTDVTRLRQAIEGGYNRFLKRMRDQFLILVPNANVTLPQGRNWMGSVGIGVDPVTGV